MAASYSCGIGAWVVSSGWDIGRSDIRRSTSGSVSSSDKCSKGSGLEVNVDFMAEEYIPI